MGAGPVAQPARAPPPLRRVDQSRAGGGWQLAWRRTQNQNAVSNPGNGNHRPAFVTPQFLSILIEKFERHDFNHHGSLQRLSRLAAVALKWPQRILEIYESFRPGEYLAYWTRTADLADRAHCALKRLIRHIGPAGVPPSDILIRMDRAPLAWTKSGKMRNQPASTRSAPQPSEK